MALRDLRAPYPDRPLWWAVLARTDVLAGLLFMAIAIFGLWVSRDYPVGTALRMSTGYVPRLLCWVLLLLGAIVALIGIGERSTADEGAAGGSAWRPLVFVVGSIVAFGLSIERLGLVAATFLLVGVGSLAARGLRPLETFVAAVILATLTVGIFIVGLGLTMPIWPDW